MRTWEREWARVRLVTMCNDKQLPADKPINRYVIGDRDKLAFNAADLLDLSIQRELPESYL